jgi:hypothetical protein
METPNENSEQQRPPFTTAEADRRLGVLRRTVSPEFAAAAEAAMGLEAKSGLTFAEIRAAAERVLEEFERKAEAAHAQHQREVAARQNLAAETMATSARIQRESARAAARSNPLPANEILRRVEQSGFRVRLHDGDIQIAPDCGLDPQVEAYLVEYADLIATHLVALESWRSVANVAFTSDPF